MSHSWVLNCWKIHPFYFCRSYVQVNSHESTWDAFLKKTVICVILNGLNIFSFFHCDLDMKHYSSFIFIAYLFDKTENTKKKGCGCSTEDDLSDDFLLGMRILHWNKIYSWKERLCHLCLCGALDHMCVSQGVVGAWEVKREYGSVHWSAMAGLDPLNTICNTAASAECWSQHGHLADAWTCVI